MGFGMGKVLAGQDGVEERTEFRVLGVDARHLLVVRTGDDCRRDAASPQVGEEVKHTLNIREGHLALEVVEAAGDGRALTLQRAAEVGVVDLHKGLPLDAVLESGAVGVIETELRAPEL